MAEAERSPRSYAVLSIAAAVVTALLKFTAYRLTGSVGLLSDAAESLVNLAAALVAYWALSVAARPPDEEHAFGHSKAEYFSSGIEGALIVAAAVAIAAAAGRRLVHPEPLTRVSLGLGISIAAALVNGAVALVLLSAGRRLRSITLKADAHHLLTDVWTTAAVVAAVGLVQATGWLLLDPIVALAVAVSIVWAGWRLLKETGLGLMDTGLPPEDCRAIAEALAPFHQTGVVIHAIHTRAAGARRFVSMHVLVPGAWSVQNGHDLCEKIESAVCAALPQTTVFTHMEPREDPVSWDDRSLDRPRPG
ncbi:MAG: cation diffusion facilitator family transporter [Thermoanaerobaculia bacterium]